MGVSIDLNRYDYEKTKKALLEKTNEKDENVIDKILQEFGTKINNDYIILNNEYYEDGNCFYKILEFIERYYKLEDGDAYDCLIYSDKEAMVDYKEIDRACENIGIDIEELDVDEDEDGDGD